MKARRADAVEREADGRRVSIRVCDGVMGRNGGRRNESMEMETEMKGFCARWREMAGRGGGASRSGYECY